MEALERDFAAWMGVRGAVVTGFGRSALALALEVIPVRGGDVLVPDFICAQVPEAVRRVGARPEFYPVRRDLAVFPSDFQAAFTPRTRAAIVAHYFGQVLPGISSLATICRERGVPLIEDCALALGAARNARRAGGLADLAVFSLTKSDWCYGGGVVTSNQPERVSQMRARREQTFQAWPKLSFIYGVLRRADFAANRPTRSRVAESSGRWLERLSGVGRGNFYDAGRFDAAMPGFAARRAQRLLANLPAIAARRQRILQQLTEALDGAEHLVFRRQLDLGDAASFLLLQCLTGRAERWRAQAAGSGVTLRRCWPPYQAPEEAQTGSELAWLAEHLLVLEIHPGLTAAEIERTAQTLRRLAAGQGNGGTGD